MFVRRFLYRDLSQLSTISTWLRETCTSRKEVNLIVG